jgi:hypothetical protein
VRYFERGEGVRMQEDLKFLDRSDEDLDKAATIQGFII